MVENTVSTDVDSLLESRGVSRRDFIKFCGALAVAAGLSQAAAPRVAMAVESVIGKAEGGLFPVLWIEGASCTGCTESFAQIETPDVGKVVLELISLNYSDVLCAGAGHSIEEAKKQTIEAGGYIVVYEGGITQGFGGNTLRVAMETGEDILAEAASNAAAVVALGSCAVNGGWMAAYPNSANATGVSDFLKKRGIEKPSSTERDRLFNQFLTMLYQRRYRQMRDFVRSLGCTKALSDQNMGTSPHLSSMRLNYDFVDNHLYFNHPEFAGKTWGLPSFTRSHSVLSEYAEVPAQLFQSRIFGKPFMVTEFDFAKPNPHRADGALLFGVYGALQQWDGLFQFAYTHGMDKVRFMSRTDGYFDLMTDPVKLLSQYLGAAFFLNGELAEENSERNFGFSIPTRIPDSFEMLYPIEYSRIGLCAKIGGIPEGVSFPNVKGLPESRTELKKIVKQLAPKGEFCSAGGKVRLNPARQVFQVSTPRGEAFILPPGQAGQGDFCRIRNKIGSAVFGILSLDDLPLKSSKRMLLLHLTDSSAAKMRYADQDCRKLESWGTLPYLAARGEAEISLKPESGEFQLYAVDSAGKRLGEIPLNKQADGSLKAVLRVFQPFGQVFAYELRKKNILSTNNSQHF